MSEIRITSTKSNFRTEPFGAFSERQLLFSYSIVAQAWSEVDDDPVTPLNRR